MTISLVGLNLPWLNPEKKGRGRVRYDTALGEFVPLAEWVDRQAEKSAYFMPDLDQVYGDQNFVSVIDDTVITSRSQLREHNKRHGVIQTGDVRGEQLRSKMKRHMRHDPSKIDPSVWVQPRDPEKVSGNLTEI